MNCAVISLAPHDTTVQQVLFKQHIGSDIIVKAWNSAVKAVNTKLGTSMEVVWEMSCEKDAAKRALIMECCPEVKLLFTDAAHLAEGRHSLQ